MRLPHDWVVDIELAFRKLAGGRGDMLVNATAHTSRASGDTRHTRRAPIAADKAPYEKGRVLVLLGLTQRATMRFSQENCMGGFFQPFFFA
jgi:hypothetical protein